MISAVSKKCFREVLNDVRLEVEGKRDLAQAKQWTISWKGQRVPINKLADRIVTGIERFAAVGDQVASYDPVHFALPWAGVRFLLMVRYLKSRSDLKQIMLTEDFMPLFPTNKQQRLPLWALNVFLLA